MSFVSVGLGMGWLIFFYALLLLPAALVAVPSIGRRVRRLRGQVLDRLAGLRRSSPPVNPFDALHLQSRLSALADEILRLDSDPEVYARAFRIKATRSAYDQVLAEACHLAGVRAAVSAPEGEGSVESTRMSAELELAARGWSW